MGKIKLGPKSMLYPMPAVLVGANVHSKPNYLMIAFCGIVNAQPPLISVSLNRRHYTYGGIKENGTFSVNIPSAGMVKISDYCGIVSGNTADKSGLFDTFYGGLGTAPMIRECPINLECRLINLIDFDIDTAFIGEIVEAYTEEKFLSSGHIDIKKIDPMVFATHERGYFRIGEYAGQAWKIGSEYAAKDDIRKGGQ
jgi:flavin reductase (DIM6/NTAB) family NADH-FMN oxidoreductase RutF